MFHIRKAVAEDALSTAIVNVYTWKTAYTGLIPETIIDTRILELEQIAKQIRTYIEKDDNVLIAVMDGTVVGFCSYVKSRNDRYPSAGEIQAFYILQGLQGQGIGKALFLATAQEICDKNYTSMIVNCLHKNKSLDFYLYMGGEVVGQREDELYGETIIEDIIYFKDLRVFNNKY